MSAHVFWEFESMAAMFEWLRISGSCRAACCDNSKAMHGHVCFILQLKPIESYLMHIFSRIICKIKCEDIILYLKTYCGKQ